MTKAPQGMGHQSVFQSGEQGVKWLGLEILRLEGGESWKGQLKDEEAAPRRSPAAVRSASIKRAG